MTASPARTPRYSLVIPVFNEEAVLPVLVRRLDLLMQQLDGPAETIFVDDGSRDCSGIVLRQKAKDDPRFRYIALSRNFGHQIAITAGIEAASGDAVVVMDADLQDPPEVVLDMVARWKDGYEVVYGRAARIFFGPPLHSHTETLGWSRQTLGLRAATRQPKALCGESNRFRLIRVGAPLLVCRAV